MDAPIMITQPWDLRQQESPQPSSRLPSLLNFARLFLPIKNTFSCSKNRRSKLHAFSKISADVFWLLDFEMCLHCQLLNVFSRDPTSGVSSPMYLLSRVCLMTLSACHGSALYSSAARRSKPVARPRFIEAFAEDVP